MNYQVLSFLGNDSNVHENMKPNNKPSSVVSEIKLKSACLLATKSDIAELDFRKSVCYAFVCKEALFSFEDVPSSLPRAVTNILQEFADVFPQDVPPGLPPIRGIEHQIDLIPGASLPNRDHTVPIQRRRRRLCVKYKSFSTKVIYANPLVLVIEAKVSRLSMRWWISLWWKSTLTIRLRTCEDVAP